MSPAPEVQMTTIEVMPPRGVRPFLRLLEVAAGDKRFRLMFKKHEGVTPTFKKKKWCHPRSYYERLHILSVHGRVALDEIFQTFRLFPVNFNNPADPMFAGKPALGIPPQHPSEAMKRSIWSLVEDVIYLYMHCDVENDYFLLQAVLAVWGFTQVVTTFGTLESQHLALLRLTKSLLAAYIARGAPGFLPVPLTDEEIEAAEAEKAAAEAAEAAAAAAKRKKKGGAAAAAAGPEGGAGESEGPKKPKKLSKQQMDEIRAAARAVAVAEQRRRRAVLEVRAKIEPVPMWPDLIASALTDLGKGNMDAIRVVHCCQTMVDTRRDASLAVNAWPPADDAAVAAARAKDLETFRSLELGGEYNPPLTPLPFDEVMRRVAHYAIATPQTFFACK